MKRSNKSFKERSETLRDERSSQNCDRFNVGASPTGAQNNKSPPTMCIARAYPRMIGCRAQPIIAGVTRHASDCEKYISYDVISMIS